MAVATATETVDPPESRPPNDAVPVSMFARTSGAMPCPGIVRGGFGQFKDRGK
jgi:hypothetical protein